MESDNATSCQRWRRPLENRLKDYKLETCPIQKVLDNVQYITCGEWLVTVVVVVMTFTSSTSTKLIRMAGLAQKAAI